MPKEVADMSSREKLSCVVLTNNAEQEIAECLEGIKWADEIVVIDDFSDDNTLEICRKYTDKIFERKFIGYPEQRDYGLKETSHRWVLCLDADERVTPKLKEEIIRTLSDLPNVSGFYIRRLNIVLGKEVRYSGWYETNNLRLFDKNKVALDLSMKYVEKVQITGGLASLKSDLLHYACRTLDAYFKRVNAWSDLNSQDMMTKGVRVTLILMGYYFFIKPAAIFFIKYVIKRGYRDGFIGLLIAAVSAFTYFLSYAKLWERQRKKEVSGLPRLVNPAGKVGIVIVTYNNAVYLEALLSDIGAQTRKPDEVIVIDNNSKDNIEAVIKRSTVPVRYVRFDANLGSAGGFREGVRLACESNDLVWLLDDDVTVERDALALLIEGISKLAYSEKVGAVRSRSAMGGVSTLPTKASGFAWRGTLIRKDVVSYIGLPRSEYFLYGEDAEYSMRMIDRGYSIYWIPASHVVEKPSDIKMYLKFLGREIAIHKDPFRLYYANRNQINVFLEYRNFGGLMATLFYVVKVFIVFTIFERQRSGERIIAIMRGIVDGTRGRLGINPRYLPPQS